MSMFTNAVSVKDEKKILSYLKRGHDYDETASRFLRPQLNPALPEGPLPQTTYHCCDLIVKLHVSLV
jgi:hypothetical protein